MIARRNFFTFCVHADRSAKNAEARGQACSEKAAASSFRGFFIFGATLFIVGACVAVTVAFTRNNRTADSSVQAKYHFQQPETLAELLQIPTDQLGNVDIALMNLLCAEGLPGAEHINAKFELAILDDWAKGMKRYIASCDQDFSQDPAKFDNNINLSRMAAVVTFLQRIHQMKYDPNRDCFNEPNSVFFANSQDCFIHGLVEQPHFGTCSSIPVLLVAIGRRLGYPLKLVASPNHLFARWESPDGNGCFNIEGATLAGMTSHDYDYYKKPPFTLPTAKDVNSGECFHPMPPQEELATFLAMRASCLLAHKQYAEAQKAFAQAASVAPAMKSYSHDADVLSKYLVSHPQ